MKTSMLTKSISASVLSLGLALLPVTLSATAQTTTGDTTTGTTTENYQGDNDFDWGWLGLLGLIGLAGLAKRNSEPTRYRDPANPDVADRTGTRY